MSFAARLENNTAQVHGTIVVNGEERLTAAAEKDQMELMKLAYEVAVEQFSMSQPAGIVFWNGKKHAPSVNSGGNGIVVLWPQFSREHYLV